MKDHQPEKEHFLFSCLGTPRHWALCMAGFGWKMWKLCAQGGWTGPESWGILGTYRETLARRSKPCFPAGFCFRCLFHSSCTIRRGQHHPDVPSISSAFLQSFRSIPLKPRRGSLFWLYNVVHLVRAWRSAGIHMSLEVRRLDSREKRWGAVWFCGIYSLDWQNDDAKQNFQMISDGLPRQTCHFRMKLPLWSWYIIIPTQTQTPKFKEDTHPGFLGISWDVHKEKKAMGSHGLHITSLDPSGSLPGAYCIPSQAARNLRCNGLAPRFFFASNGWLFFKAPRCRKVETSYTKIWIDLDRFGWYIGMSFYDIWKFGYCNA